MEDVENMIKTTLSQIEKVLNNKTVVGEPITVGDTTLIPLLSLGFGFGVGGSGKSDDVKQGGGTAGGGGMRPVAIIIVNKAGVRIEPIKSGVAAAIEKLGEKMPDMVDKIAEKWGEKQ